MFMHLHHNLLVDLLMMRLYLLFLTLVMALLTACHAPMPTDSWDLSPAEVDSLRFVTRHHYTKGYAFEVVADSLVLASGSPYQPLLSITSDGGTLLQGERFIVLDIQWPLNDSTLASPDSIWLHVGNEQLVRGWLTQTQLLTRAIPDAPISRFIYVFSSASVLILLALMALGLGVFYWRARRSTRWYCLHVRDVASFYPTLFVIVFSATATLYGTLQAFAPEQWRHFYFYPTLSPFGQPPLIAMFLTGVWTIVIVGVAMVDDLRHRIYTSEAIVYLFTLVAVCVPLYAVFTLTPHIYIGYPLLLVYWGYALHSLFQRLRWFRPHYRCGHCGQRIAGKGVCPSCGAINS